MDKHEGAPTKCYSCVVGQCLLTRKDGTPKEKGVPSLAQPCHYRATMPSPPTAPGTVTLPTSVSAPFQSTWNSSTIPLAPVWT